VVHLDRPAEAAAFRADPDAALGALDEPVLLDEWQEVPAVLERRLVRVSVKRAVDPGRDPTRLRRYFESLALNTAGTVTEAAIFEAAGVNRRTADAYERLLTSMFLTEPLPSWTSNRLQRLSARPKRYIVDSALAASLLRVDELGVLRDGDLLGRLLDTFVASQLRAELPVARSRRRLHHLHEEHGRHEVDLLAELGGGQVVALEVKATASPARDDARHLMWLRDRLQDRFAAGIVLHTGSRPFDLDDRISAVPICALWV
jgi:predicted AAA+ superfamily ATPase